MSEQGSDHGHEDIDRAHARIEALEARIEQLEARLEEVAKGGPGPHYYESGTVHPELDDQSIAP